MVEILSEKELMEKTPWYKPKRWIVSSVTWLPEVRVTMPNLPKRVHIQDTTLREGEENISASFTMEGKVEIARRLCDMGVEIIDVGYMAHPYQEKTLETVASAGVIKKPTRVQIFTRSANLDEIKKQVDSLVKKGATATGIVVMVGTDPKIWVDAVKYAKENYPDLYVTLSYTGTTGRHPSRMTYETPRSAYDWQVKLGGEACRVGADRIQMSDSSGLGSPPAVKYIASRFREAIGPTKSILSHNHNDYGQAVACALAAVEGGADWLDTAVNGLGDRAGNTALEEVVLALEALYGIETGIKLEKIYEMSKFVEKASKVRLSYQKAVTGDRVWWEDSHSAGLVKLKRQGISFFDGGWETYDPRIVGQIHQMFFGRTALYEETVKGFLEWLKLPADKETIDKVIWKAMEEIDKKVAAGKDGFLSERDVEALCKIIAEK